MMNVSCPTCENEKYIELVNEYRELKIRDEPVRFTIEFRRCNKCGEEFVIPGIDSDPLDKAYRAYRTKHNFLQPEEIKDFRKRYNLKQGELASLLGLGGATISRYENGKLQDDTHDKLLRLAAEQA